MKKYTLLFAVIVSLTLAACGSGSTTTESIDSTAVSNVTDTTAVTKDSTSAPVVGGAEKDAAEKPVSNEAIK